MHRACRVGQRLHRAFVRDRLRFWPENVGGHDVDLRGFVDGLNGVLLKERVAPGNQIVQI